MLFIITKVSKCPITGIIDEENVVHMMGYYSASEKEGNPATTWRNWKGIMQEK